MEDFISADPCTFDHASLFKTLQNLTLEYRLNDPYASLVIIYQDFCVSSIQILYELFISYN